MNNNSPTKLSIEYTLQAIHINTRERKESSGRFAVNSYSNLAMFYKDLRLYDQALVYYDSTAMLVKKFPEQYNFILSSRLHRSDIFFHTGNYQQSIDESSAGFLESKKRYDTSWMLSFLNQKAQSQYYQGELPEAIYAADNAIAFANYQLEQYQKIHLSGSTGAMTQVYFELSTAFKTKALIYEDMGKDSLAELFFERAIKERILSVVNNDFGQVAGDYNDFGNFYLNSLESFKKANACYLKTLEYAKKTEDVERISKAYLNLGQSYYLQLNYKLAEYYYAKSLSQLGIIASPDFLQQPTSNELNRIVNKEFTLV